MKLRIMQVILITATMIILTLGSSTAFAQQDTVKGKPTVTGQMKEGSSEVGKAGKSLGHNVKHGRIVRGGKRFGKHIGYAGRHIGRGTKHAVKKAITP